MKRMDKDQNRVKMDYKRNSEKKRKKIRKKVRRLKKFQKLSEYQDTFLLGKCQIRLRNKLMNKIDLCKLEKMLLQSILTFRKTDLSKANRIL
jgi:hypothetical protein